MSSSIFKLPVSIGSINLGQGEYVSFFPDGKKVSYELYEKIYQILQDHQPLNFLRTQQDIGERYTSLRNSIKALDPELEIAFIPRTLYELFYVKKVIGEDIVNDHFCKYSNTEIFEDEEANRHECEAYKKHLNKEKSTSAEKTKHCWHLASFDYCGDSFNEGIKIMAYRLNKAIVKELKPKENGFTYGELKSFTKKILSFLMTHAIADASYKTYSGEPCIKLFSNKKEFENSYASLATRFIRGRPLVYNATFESNARIDDKQVGFFGKALHLDCSDMAKYSVFIYRGANFENDNVIQKNQSYSLSFATSLLAGIMYDGGACTLAYMYLEKNDAYAIPISYKDSELSIFYIPSGNTLTQLVCRGETWHSRTKITKPAENDPQGIFSNQYNGINIGSKKGLNNIYTSKSLKELENDFCLYKQQAFFLNRADLQEQL